MKTLITLSTIIVLFNTTLNAQTVLFQEDFNLGLPAGWTTIASGDATGTWDTTSDFYGFNFDSSPFMLCYDWSGLATNEELTGPSFSSVSFSNIYLHYDYQFLSQSATLEGFVDVYDGAAWQNVKLFSGADIANAHDSIDISAYANANMQFRFRFVNTTGNGWEHDFMIDNVIVTGNSSIGLSEITTNTISTYPNPTSGFIYWKDDIQTEIQLIEIYNASGQIIKSKNTFGVQNKMDVHDLLQGVYFIKMTSKNGETYTNKIFKE